MSFNGLGMNMGSLSRLSNAKTRSISPENFSGEKGRGAMAVEGTGSRASRGLGIGWKVSPSIKIDADEMVVLADIDGSGAIQHIWMTPAGGVWRHAILRMYWDDNEYPSVEVPVGDFFACGWGGFAQLSSLAVCINPRSGLNSYWEMPFKKRCRITMENIGVESMVLYYQIDYTLTEVPEDCAYFHASFRRENPLKYMEDFTIIDGIEGKGQFVGTYMAWGVNNKGWWGEGEIKFYIDGDVEYPTICGTGTEDYFCGSYDFDLGIENGGYREFTTPYAGLSQVIRPDGLYDSQTRFSMYRWHIADPIRFDENLKVTMQALGWRNDGRYLPLQDDISSVAYWYQTIPHNPLKPLPDRDYLEVI